MAMTITGLPANARYILDMPYPMHIAVHGAGHWSEALITMSCQLKRPGSNVQASLQLNIQGLCSCGFAEQATVS